MKIEDLYNKALTLLKAMIETPSFSGEEDKTGDMIVAWFESFGVETNRVNNNIWATNKYFDETKPTVLLNSHHDTVMPNKAYTNNPHESIVMDGKLYGLGSNDAGGCLVSLMATFVYYYEAVDLAYNIVIAATGEEEDSGPNGLNSLLKLLPNIDFAIVGEPTEMHLAIAEKGLLVIDGYASGIPGHAAHENTVNAIYNAMKDIDWIKQYKFDKTSDVLGKVKMSVTQINAGQLHNLVPAVCHFVMDVRVNEAYSNEEVFEIIDKHTNSELKPRSFRLNSSSIPIDHPIVKSGIALGRDTYGSPTLSDQSVLNCPSLKLGPGLSTRSHSADEYIFIKEIEEGISLYIDILGKVIS